MDTYENQNMQEQPANVVQEQPRQPVYQQPIYQQPVYQYAYAQPVEKPKQKKSKAWMAILAAVLVFALVVCSCGFTAASINAYWHQQNSALSKSFNEKLAALREEMEDKSYVGSGESISGTPNTTPDGSLTPAQVYAKHVASVVAIKCTVSSGYYQSTSSGSGFVLTEDGYIATNYHVVDGARSITITCADGTSYSASAVGGDEANDIALLKAEATGLQPATIGRSDHLIVGDQVVAIGNPLGTLASTLTVGYVSAKDRVITTEGSSINMIQTDAAINPGNSGGPLFNMKGEVIGITSAKYSGLTNSGATIEGIGFAIPMDDVIGMLQDLMNKGYISGAYLGVNVVDVSQSNSLAYGIPMGALISYVETGSPAEAAGLQVQDVIVNLGGYDIKSESDLSRALRKIEAGTTVTITVFRIGAGGEISMNVTLGEKPNSNQQTNTGNSQTRPNGNNPNEWFDYYF